MQKSISKITKCIRHCFDETLADILIRVNKTKRSKICNQCLALALTSDPNKQFIDKELQSFDLSNNWIDCSDGNHLPEKNEYYLVSLADSICKNDDQLGIQKMDPIQPFGFEYQQKKGNSYTAI